MSIYDLNLEGIRAALLRFGKTWYGKSVFMFAYFIPFVLFISTLILLLLSIVLPKADYLMNCALYAIIAFVPFFMVGNAYYYSELRKYIDHEAKKK